MKTNTPKILTFLRAIDEGHIANMRAEVYWKIKNAPSISTRSLILACGSHQSVTSSLSALESDGLIRKSGQIQMDKQVYSQWVALTDIDGIESHAKEVDLQKRIQWAERALKCGWIDNQVFAFLISYLKVEIYMNNEQQ
jgi:hypothetical protein